MTQTLVLPFKQLEDNGDSLDQLDETPPVSWSEFFRLIAHMFGVILWITLLTGDLSETETILSNVGFLCAVPYHAYKGPGHWNPIYLFVFIFVLSILHPLFAVSSVRMWFPHKSLRDYHQWIPVLGFFICVYVIVVIFQQVVIPPDATSQN